MLEREVQTLIIGAGQAGLAMSEHLGKRRLPHLILERGRVVERWRSERWDSLVANGPAWHDRFPSMRFDGIDQDGFATKDQIVDYFVAYARQIAAPVRCGTEVTALHGNAGVFRAETSAGVIEAANVVVATGPFQRPTGTRGSVAERLLGALAAGRDTGGEAGPVHSAGILLVRDVDWPTVDLRIDWTEGDPVAELESLYRLYAPQAEDYVRRALDPSQARGFGVPGDPRPR